MTTREERGDDYLLIGEKVQMTVCKEITRVVVKSWDGLDYIFSCTQCKDGRIGVHGSAIYGLINFYTESEDTLVADLAKHLRIQLSDVTQIKD